MIPGKQEFFTPHVSLIAAVITTLLLNRLVFITTKWIKMTRVKILEMVRVYRMEDQIYILQILLSVLGTTVAQWLRYCATNRKVAGSIPDGVIGIFH